MVNVYSFPDCPWCKKVKTYLNIKNIPFTDIDIEADEAGRQTWSTLSPEMKIPLVEIDGHIVVGFDKEKIDHYLQL